MLRYGVLIGNSEFPGNAGLSRLCGPFNDVKGLATVLRDPARGGFAACECLDNRRSSDIKPAIEECLVRAAEDNGMALLHYSGHGLLDREGRLYLCAYDTRPNAFESMVSFESINDCIRRSGAKKVVIFLDCCYSGAAGYRYRSPADLAGTEQQLDGFSQQEGIYLLTATSRSQLAAEPLNGQFGVFTKHVIDGIASGSAAKDGSEDITVTDIYSYVKSRMDEQKIGQTPEYWNLHRVGEDLVIAKKPKLKGTDAKPLQADERWRVLQEERGAILDLITPCYVLDSVFHFLDWNTCFERVIARQHHLRRGSHVGEFLVKLKNYSTVEERAFDKFPPDSNPLVDLEPFEFESQEFGVMRFQKLACQIAGTSGEPRAWSVNLNICHVDEREKFWRAMEQTLAQEVNWAKYAKVYDTVIGDFEGYRELLNLVVGNVGPARVCLDLGAGTGNSTVRLLSSDAQRTVLSVDNNEAMLRILDRKLAEQGPDFQARASVRKGDILTCLREERSDTFDACVMMNVLFALDRPAECLREVFRVLKPGGILSLSTSRSGTKIERLFSEIQRSLVRRGIYHENEANFKDAFQRNKEMAHLITRDNLAEIHRYISDCGFQIESWRDDLYVRCVVLVKARKPV